ncbi:MAG: HAMP domain-containing histidine kinase [Pirellulaceae bacterium]|nr:HAMP domain-containing histidine kinase [Pirellulaceae bacterium]
MRLPPLIHPHVYAHPTLDTAIWFLHLRWLAVVGQLLTLVVAGYGLKVDLPAQQIVTLIAITAITNVAYWLWLVRMHRTGLHLADRLPNGQIISALMLIDILDLTGLLYLTAGTTNPFWLFYFVNVAIAAAIVTPAWAWMLWSCTVLCVVMLLAIRVQPIDLLGSPMSSSEVPARWSISKLGYLISFVACSGIITYFITILTGQLRQREQAIKEAEEAKSRNRQLESLATLAGGAAHELASPLSTIAVVAKELMRRLERQSASEPILNDVQLIRTELDRCRIILDRMTAATGDAAGERLRSIYIDEFMDESLLGIRDMSRVNVSIQSGAEHTPSLLPVQAAAQAIRNLVQNALDASPEGTDVQVQAAVRNSVWCIDVIDQGEGMSDAVQQRLGEPFFTTKEPGKGMGLGVYLSLNVIRRLGGSLDFVSQRGQGTQAQVRLPVTSIVGS